MTDARPHPAAAPDDPAATNTTTSHPARPPKKRLTGRRFALWLLLLLGGVSLVASASSGALYGLGMSVPDETDQEFYYRSAQVNRTYRRYVQTVQRHIHTGEWRVHTGGLTPLTCANERGIFFALDVRFDADPQQFTQLGDRVESGLKAAGLTVVERDDPDERGLLFRANGKGDLADVTVLTHESEVELYARSRCFPGDSARLSEILYPGDVWSSTWNDDGGDEDEVREDPFAPVTFPIYGTPAWTDPPAEG